MILLDTHVAFWMAAEPHRLSRPAARAIRKAVRSGGLAVASITLWELAVLFASGRIRGRGTVDEFVGAILEATGSAVREITPAIAALATQFPESFSSDPADRLIAATARGEGLPLVTRDDRIRESPLIKTIW